MGEYGYKVEEVYNVASTHRWEDIINQQDLEQLLGVTIKSIQRIEMKIWYIYNTLITMQSAFLLVSPHLILFWIFSTLTF